MSAAHGLLAGRVALVVGLDEIGAGIANRFVREGARVALLSIDDERQVALDDDVAGKFIANEIGIPAADPDSVALAIRDTVAKLAAPLDVLVCNLLSAAAPRLLEHLDTMALDVALSRVRSTVAAMRAALPALRDSGRGRIVLVGHRYGESVSEALGAYNAAAWSLVGLARTAALEWGQYQIATNVLLPLTQTAEFDDARTRRPKVIDLLVSQLPLRRVGHPIEDIGGAAAFLASDAVCFVNGQVVCADGGQQVAGPVLNPARFT
ncbi:MAG: SDR family oxidoreductase [Lysobacterales bacterium]|nr:MAG: SDR family oxidoreductase [Xanthomonadales bacterium]